MDEFKSAVRQYLTLKYERVVSEETKESQDLESYIVAHEETFLTNLFRCMILNNIYWGVWGICMIKEEDANKDIFNYAFANGRIEVNQFLRAHPEIKAYL